MIYGNETTVVAGGGEATNATDYKNRLNSTLGYEWVHLVAHGNKKGHYFDTEKGPPPKTEVSSTDIRYIDPHAFFYNLESCFVGDYSWPYGGYMAGSYLFADTYGLLVVASTTYGGMGAWIGGPHLSNFYGPMAEGKCIGQAFKEWSQKAWEPGSKFNYGLTILGDPTLRTPRIYNQTRDIAVTNVTAGEARFCWEVSINVTVKNEGIFVETFNVTVYRNDTIIETQVVCVFPGASRTLTFIWNTTGVASGAYTIKAVATPVPYETDMTDNTYVDGTVTLNYLTVRAEDQNGSSLTAGYVYIDGKYCGRTCSTFLVLGGTHEVLIKDFWESGNTGYRYCWYAYGNYGYWEDNPTDMPRNITVTENRTITAHFNKKWCPGDANGNGKVTIADMILVQNNFGEPVQICPEADVNGDSKISVADMTIVQINFGNVYPDP